MVIQPNSQTETNLNAEQKGFSLIELLIVVAIILIIAAIVSQPGLRVLRRMSRRRRVGSHHQHSHDFLQLQLPDGRLCDQPGASVGTCTGSVVPSSTSACLIDTTLASGTKSGYKFGAAGTSGGYAAWATPVTLNTTGVRSFCSVADAVVRTATLRSYTCNGTEAPLQ